MKTEDRESQGIPREDGEKNGAGLVPGGREVGENQRHPTHVVQGEV
jgi:hypothetical protein